MCSSSMLEGVTHEAWCLGLPAALVSSSAEVLTVGLKLGVGGGGRRGQIRSEGEKTVWRDRRGTEKKQEEAENTSHLNRYFRMLKVWISIVLLCLWAGMKSYQCQFVVIEQMHRDTYVCAHMHTENTHKTAQLAHKYFCEQDVGNDKHSSWLLNRSALQCVVHSMCTRFTVPCMCVCGGVDVGWGAGCLGGSLRS